MRGSRWVKLTCWRKKQVMKELLRERRRTEDEKGRDTVVVGRLEAPR